MKITQLILAGLIGMMVGCYVNGDLASESTSNGENSAHIDEHHCEFDASCCEEVEYCGIPKDSLLRYIAEYRDHVWRYTSEYFKMNQYNPKILIDGSAPTNDPTAFDARYMDIDLAYLKNYLCRITNVEYPGVKDINTLRLFYIRYDELKGLGDDSAKPFDIGYAHKHSIAIVPVNKKVSFDKIVSVEFADSLAGILPALTEPGPYCADDSPYANYNQLCPPLVDCGDLSKSLIWEADTNY